MNTTLLKSLIPRPVKQRLRDLHRAYSLRSALRDTERLLAGVGPTPAELAQRLLYGWSNEGWAAKPELIAFLLDEFRGFRGTLLECGSGLSTILLSMIARRTGATVVSLEHNAQWHALVLGRLHAMNVPPSQLVLAPLESRGAFDWYSDVPALKPVAEIQAVICDGPPQGTRGGRYGLLPCMQSRLSRGAKIIVDDSHRDAERQMIARWLQESDGRLVVERSFPTFSVLSHA